MGEWLSRHHGYICFKRPFGFEYSEDNKRLYLYRNKHPKWRMELYNKINKADLASSLRKAAEFLNKRINNDNKE